MTIPKLGAVAVVLHEGNLLLIKRKNNPNAGLWGFPGGHVEFGETGLACSTRELLEETGVTANALKYLTNIDLIQRADDGSIKYHYLLAVVHCQYLKGTPKANDDALDAAWYSIDEILENEIDLTENVREIALLALNEQPIKT